MVRPPRAPLDILRDLSVVSVLVLLIFRNNELVVTAATTAYFICFVALCGVEGWRWHRKEQAWWNNARESSAARRAASEVPEEDDGPDGGAVAMDRKKDK
eukprot:CAMPEP_0194269506 /NCGR_PEP_ID=MMETSP0169-20130528/3652_1 /TAXON_ID=218684 /ORGANISM="Corethron pennatum, Strain L29A3" /LENGTH=99 /DNA_ID=CAMNT_0039011175 /DNA_START=169 /DNA_END=468 /DNA_ORIENTATION=-